MDTASSAASPDLSPVSTTSALLTPNDSPAKPFDPKFVGSFDFGQPYHSHTSSLLFETGVSSRYHESATAGDSPTFHYGQLQPENTFTNPFFEPFGDRPSTAPVTPGLLSLPQSHLRVDPTGHLWGPQRLRSLSSEWTRAEEKSSQSFGTLDGEPTSRAFQTSQSHSSHEVNLLGLRCFLRCI